MSTEKTTSGKGKSEGLVAGTTGQVSVSGGATLNMGDYESLKISVGLTLPCEPTLPALKKTYTTLVKEVKSLLNNEIRSVKGKGAINL